MLRAKTKKNVTYLLTASLLVAAPLLRSETVSASPLNNRSVTISDSRVSVTTRHLFKFTVPSYGNVGSIKFEYCSNSPFTDTFCDAPAGLSTSSAVLSSQTGETGFSIFTPTSSNKIVLTRNATATSGLPVSYTFDSITNPSAANKPVFVRISTYTSTDATGSFVDEGAVLFSTAQNISVNGYVPPYLIFCAGVSVSVNCSSATGYFLDFGDLVTRNPRALTSQYSGATNDPGGFNTTIFGTTMTSGNNIIPALTTPTVSKPGVSQFGLNVRANSNPGVGSEPDGPGTSVAVPEYSTPNQFFFNKQVISNSILPTDFTRFTASYIVNVSDDQRPGIYSTTITYIASAAF